MANGVGFEGANTVMLAPESMSADECLDLPVFVNGTQTVSCWRFSEEEIEKIKETGVVWLSVLGQGMPPVALAATGIVTVGDRDPVAEPYIEPAKRS